MSRWERVRKSEACSWRWLNASHFSSWKLPRENSSVQTAKPTRGLNGFSSAERSNPIHAPSPPSPSPPAYCWHAASPQGGLGWRRSLRCSTTLRLAHRADRPGGRCGGQNRTPGRGIGIGWCSSSWPCWGCSLLSGALNPCSETSTGALAQLPRPVQTRACAWEATTSPALENGLLRGRQQRPSASHRSMTTSTTGAVSRPRRRRTAAACYPLCWRRTAWRCSPRVAGVSPFCRFPGGFSGAVIFRNA